LRKGGKHPEGSTGKSNRIRLEGSLVVNIKRVDEKKKRRRAEMKFFYAPA